MSDVLRDKLLDSISGKLDNIDKKLHKIIILLEKMNRTQKNPGS